MRFLAQEMALWIGLAFVVGLISGAVSSLKRVVVERWEEIPVANAPVTETEVEPQPSDPTADEVTEESESSVDLVSPFPVLEGSAVPTPWEQEEAWSRPSKVAERSTARRGARDNWDDAASNWRSWADEATNRPSEAADADRTGAADDWGDGPTNDDDLFARDREQEDGEGRVSDEDLFAGDRQAHASSPFAASPVSPVSRDAEGNPNEIPVDAGSPFAGLGGVAGDDSPFPSLAADEEWQADAQPPWMSQDADTWDEGPGGEQPPEQQAQMDDDGPQDENTLTEESVTPASDVEDVAPVEPGSSQQGISEEESDGLAGSSQAAVVEDEDERGFFGELGLAPSSASAVAT